ncbi:hypothetical protein SAMN02745181_0696 [Rubritalea squalenifaciens DSM 18772]|uniref:Uncharacterized protein n=1 Tax=Rubritalea squalenifaciens DSM 18772 TaxID=1123071 RepID=A0A1M6DBI1_9BACT|nr:hypothetical protein [Rubritalea squalenifaciens]SHI70614.1 hypothetical protein SAMN02745181_0696 [Rubritalea squalenifaciens DSM 18772]
MMKKIKTGIDVCLSLMSCMVYVYVWYIAERFEKVAAQQGWAGMSFAKVNELIFFHSEWLIALFILLQIGYVLMDWRCGKSINHSRVMWLPVFLGVWVSLAYILESLRMIPASI